MIFHYNEKNTNDKVTRQTKGLKTQNTVWTKHLHKEAHIDKKKYIEPKPSGSKYKSDQFCDLQ